MPMNGSGGRRHRLLRARAWLRRHPPPPDPPLRLWERTGLALAGTGLLALPVLFDATWALNGVALLPWVVLAAHPRYRAYWGSSLGLFLAGAWGFSVLAFQLRFPSGVAPFLLAGWNAAWFLPFPLLVRRLTRTTPWPLAAVVPAAWVVTEYLRGVGSIARLDVFQMGYTLAHQPAWVQMADLTGVWGPAALAGAVNGLLAEICLGRAGGLSRRFRWSAAAVAAAVLVALGYGGWRGRAATLEPGPTLALIQPSLSPALAARPLAAHLSALILSAERVPAGAADLIVWPELTIQDQLNPPGRYRFDLGWLGREKQAHLLVGAVGRDPATPDQLRNRAYYFSERGDELGHSDRRRLLPFRESAPFAPFLARLGPDLEKRYRRWVVATLGQPARFAPGDRHPVFDLPTAAGPTRFAVLLGDELAAPAPGRAAVRAGARMLITLARGPESGPAWTRLVQAQAILRAVEHRISVARTADTGFAGIVAPTGRLQPLGGTPPAATPGAGYRLGPAPGDARRGTLYTLAGDWLAYAGLGLVSGGLVVGRRRRSGP